MRKLVPIMLVAIATVILISVLIPPPGPTRSPQSSLLRQLHAAATACDSYFVEYGQHPASLLELDHNHKNIRFIDWGKSGTNDGWGRPLHFSSFDASRGYGSVMSYGRDGQPGGTGRDADIEVRFGERQRGKR